MNNENFIELDEKNTIENYSSDSYNNDLIIFSNSISSIFDNNVGKEFNNFFNKILGKKNHEKEKKDILEISYKIAHKIELDKFKFNSYIDGLLNCEDKTEFIFNSNNVTKLSIILVGIFQKLKKKEKIKKYKEFLIEVEEIYKIQKINSIYKKYKIKNDIIDNNFNNNNNKESIFSFLDKYSNSEEENSKKIKDNFFLPKSNKIYKYPNNKKDENDDDLIELKFLVKKFEMIKKISFFLNENYYDNYYTKSICLILLNYEWLFPHLIEIEINLNNKKIFQVLNKLNLKKIKQFFNINNNNINLNFNINNQINDDKFFNIKNDNFNDENNNENENLQDSFELITNDEIEDETSNQKNFYKKNKNFFNIIIILSYFISKFNLFIIHLNIPYSFQNEIVNNLILDKINILNFNFFNFFVQKNGFKKIIIDFNSIDFDTFDKVISFVYSNISLGILKISLFPKENFFSIENIFNINNINKNFLKKFQTNNNNNEIENIVENNENLNVEILKKIFFNFKINLKKFFILLLQLDNLTEINLILELPSILLEINLYSMIILKFILNFFIYVFIKKNNQNKNIKNKIFLQNVSLISNVFLDNRKFPFLNNFFKTNFKNLTNYKIENLIIKAKFFELKNITNIIHFNLIYLNLGELDTQTFTSVINHITSSEFSIKSSLKTINLSLNKTILNFNDENVSENYYQLFTNFPKNLKNIIIYSFIEINNQDLRDLIEVCNYSTIKKIYLKFSKINFDNNNIINNTNNNINNNNIIINNSDSSTDEIDSNNKNNDNNNNNDNFNNNFNVYYIERNEKITNLILNIMFKMGEKNKNFLNYNIYFNIEKFLVKNEKKDVFVKYN